MKKLPIYLLVIAVMATVAACKNDDNNPYDVYKAWHEENDAWLQKEQVKKNPDGTPYYQTLVPLWNPAASVLIHYVNDRSKTEGNLSPILTSMVDTRYKLFYYNGTAIDSSTNNTQYGPGIFRTQLNSVIAGWAIALQDMRVGDSAEIVVPYQWGYGINATSGVMPFSNLCFNVSLVDIVTYEKNPESVQ